MYVYTGELLGQPSQQSAGPRLPDWARIYIKSVHERSRDSLAPYVSFFETITFHPYPFASSSPLLKALVMLEKEPSEVPPVFLSELRKLRDSRLLQNKNFAQLHENHMKLFQDVGTSFNKFKPTDLEPFLLESLLLPPPSFPGGAFFRGEPYWNLGKRFVQAKLPTGLSTRVTKSAWYMQDALFTKLALHLYYMAVKYKDTNANFKKKVEIERKARAKRP